MSGLVDKNGKEVKPLETTIMHFISFPIQGIGNGDVKVHSEEFFHTGFEDLMYQVGGVVEALEAKDEEGKLMIYPLSERKVLGIQEQIARWNNHREKEKQGEIGKGSEVTVVEGHDGGTNDC